MSIVQLPSGSWRTQLRQQGFPRFDQVHPTKEAAEAAEAAEKARRRGIVSEGPNMLLRDAIAGYTRSEQFLELAPRTKRSYTHALDQVSNALGEYTLGYLGDRVSVISGYRDQRRTTKSARTGRPLGADAVRIELSALSQVFQWAIEGRIFTHNPLLTIRRKRGPKRKVRLHMFELNNLKRVIERGSVPEHRTYARFLLLQLQLYCRPGELAQVRLADIEEWNRNCIFRDTKNGLDRNVYISDAALELLNEQIQIAIAAESTYLFHTVSKSGQHVPYNYAWWHKQFKKIGFVGEKFVPHVMRKEAISSALESSVPTPTIQLMTGHRSIKSVEEYAVDLEMSEYSKGLVEQHSHRRLLRGDFDKYNRPQVALDKAKASFSALTPELRAQLLAELQANPPSK